MYPIADLVLIIHCAFVLFVVGGLPAIWIGSLCGWRWVRNLLFRMIHLAAIVFVAIEAILGMACPLTVWEDALRGALTESSFVARWLRRLLYYDLPEWIFACAYVLFAVAVAATWWRVTPRPSRKPPPLK